MTHRPSGGGCVAMPPPSRKLEKIHADLDKLRGYFYQLMVNGFSGNVNVRLDQGTLQRNIKKEENDRLDLGETR